MMKPEQISSIWDAHTVPVFGKTGINPIVFARAIEAEVRKDDEALIRQMLESMCWAARVMIISEDEAPGYFAAIFTARARLEQPCA